jgi:hypothetical protein
LTCGNIPGAPGEDQGAPPDQDNGGYEAFEFGDTDLGALGELRDMERELADLLSEDDVTAVAETLEPGSTAALLVVNAKHIPTIR